MKDYRVINKRIPNIEGKKIVTEQANYSSDIRLPGTLLGKILPNPHAHAKILGIENSKAQALSGASTIVIGLDVIKSTLP